MTTKNKMNYEYEDHEEYTKINDDEDHEELWRRKTRRIMTMKTTKINDDEDHRITMTKTRRIMTTKNTKNNDDKDHEE